MPFKPSYPLRRALLAAWLLPATLALAAPTDEDELLLAYGDASMVQIATGGAMLLRRAPAVATVITARQITAMGATDLDQVLESVPGLHVNRSINNLAPLYMVRGIVSQFTPQLLVLQNGIPITTLYHGNKGNIWGGYPVEHIARIEIIRGPGSALYGADAFSGVVNIITKAAADTPGTTFGVQAGSFDSRDGWVQHGGKVGAVDVALYARHGRTNGFKRTVDADAQSRNDTLAGTHASLAPGSVNVGNEATDANLDLGWGAWRARAGYKLRDKVGTGAGIAGALDPVGYSRTERSTFDLSWAEPHLSDNWGATIQLSNLRYVQEVPMPYVLFPAGQRFPTGLFPNGMLGAPETWESTWRLSALATYSGLAGHQLRFGIGHDDLDLYRTRERRNFNYAPNGLPIPLPAVIDVTSTTPFLLPHRRLNDYVFVQDEWNLARDWALTAGLRHDRYSDFGSTTNPRMALVWDASLDVTAKLLYGRAFRAPAYVESYGITNPVVIGNPRLKPERNNTLEMALAWQANADLQWNLSLYRYAMSNIIRTLPNPVAGTGATYANTGDQTGHGAELEATWAASRTLRLMGNYAWQRSTDQATGRDAGYAPRHHLFVRADWQIDDGYLANAQVNRVAGRQRAAGDARSPIADYTTLDLTLSSGHAKPGWGFAVSVRNLFNADVREPSPAPGLALPHDLPMAPRALTLQVSYKL